MTDKMIQDEMRAARNDMAQLLNEIVIAPLKGELNNLLDVALYPIDKEIKDGHVGAMALINKIWRTLDRNYPTSSLPLDDQFQALLDVQHSAEDQAQNRANDLANSLSAKAETLSQQTLQALLSHSNALNFRLTDHHQAFHTHTQAQLQALNDANRVAHCESNDRFLEQMVVLKSAQQSTETQVIARAEHLAETLGIQAETLSQLSLQALHIHNDTLEARLNDHHQVLVTHTQAQLQALSDASEVVYREGNNQLFEQLKQLGHERTKRLEALIAVLASKGRTSVTEVIAEQEQRQQAAISSQATKVGAQHEVTLQTLAALQQHLLTRDAQATDEHEATSQTLAVLQHHLLAQDAKIDYLQGQLQRTAGHTKTLLYSCLPMGLVSLGALAYLILRIG
ncbi:hypothetical protein [Pseudomonas fluorescens]|jgi:hypothetical protein|uniref:Uncharacterized protein n=1 Tax=Pseudomonas fluorescens TaxID=294 RepID=A0A5E7UK29_PSEFL|nr:hypothetical protein [Pseudomonas fluorescens]VVQ10739.1 hypothetical protein PS922_04741 [Pseudomonas fluorescens]